MSKTSGAGVTLSWRDADPRKLEPYFSLWMLALTGDGLHAKSDIAIALAMQDKELAQAQEQLLRAVGHLKDMLKQDDGQAYQEAERFVASIEERS